MVGGGWDDGLEGCRGPSLIALRLVIAAVTVVRHSLLFRENKALALEHHQNRPGKTRQNENT